MIIFASFEAFVGRTNKFGGDSVRGLRIIFVEDLGILSALFDSSSVPFVALVLGIVPGYDKVLVSRDLDTSEVNLSRVKKLRTKIGIVGFGNTAKELSCG